MPLSSDTVRPIAEELTRPERFFVGAGLSLTTSHLPAEVQRWEVFQGRLLAPEHTRQEATFACWNVHLIGPEGTSPEPVVSLRLGADDQLHVVRAVDGYVQEGYDSGGGVYLTREARRPVRELVASFDLARFERPGHLYEEAAAAIGRAIVGGRLPLTAVEAPHPLFSFGRLFYQGGQPPAHRTLEARLRAAPLDQLANEALSLAPDGPALLAALWALFQDVSLSPWTDFVEKVLRLLAIHEAAHRLTTVEVLDFEGRLLRLIGRHLTAYDLVTFHYRGANYPDALLLGLVLGDYLARLERQPGLFVDEAGRLRRRALRQAWVIRRGYEGHAVPDVPTSPGEHARAYPDGYPRVPEEQIVQTGKRRRHLFADDPLAVRLTPALRQALAASFADLDHPMERRELGAAVFLDRPFGAAKAPVEPDGTPLLASVAYSRFVAAGRLRQLGSDLGVGAAELVRVVEGLGLPGLAVEAIGPPVRHGTLGLADAARAAPDFVFLHTLPGSVQQVMGLFDFAPLEERVDLTWMTAGPVLLARPARGEGLVVHDAHWRPRLHVVPLLEGGYATRQGVEWPADGLRVTQIDGAPAAVRLPARGGAGFPACQA